MYAPTPPTLTNREETKTKFYENVHGILNAVPNACKLIILDDFNARVERDTSTWEGVSGNHGVGKCNSNALPLLQTCAEHDLLITNTVSCLPTRYRTPWMHPRSKHWYLTDYVIVRKRDMQDIRFNKAVCGWIDRFLVVSKLNLRVQSERGPEGSRASNVSNSSRFLPLRSL